MTASTDSAVLILQPVARQEAHVEHGAGGGQSLEHIHRATAALASGILGIADDLAAPRDAIDGAFVAVGSRLAECAEILSRLTESFETLPIDLEGPDLTEATDRLAVVGRRAGEIAVSLGAEQADLNRLVEALRGAAHPISELRRTVKMMGIVAINARVVAASVVSETEDFGVFTTDIAQLSESAATTIQRFSRTYEALTIVVGEAATARASFEAAHRDTLSTLAVELERDLGEVTEQRLTSVRSSAITGQMSRAITDKVATTVMALQVGDATRQRVEHVEAALRDLAMILPRGVADGGEAEHGEEGNQGLVSDSATDLAFPATELQRLQLAGARETLIVEMASGAEALTRLADDVGAVLEHARQVYGSAENRSALSELHGAVRRAVTVLRDCESEREKLDRVAGAVSETVKVLLEHVEAVQEIEYKMRLVSLNAAVKCAQLGPRGRALDVIAQQLRTLTGETVVSAHEAVERLNAAARFSAAFTHATGAGAGRVGDLEREAAASLTQLETVGMRMKKALVELYDDGPRVAERLNQAVDSLANHAAISEAFSDIELGLAGLIRPQELQPTGAEPNPALAEFLAALRRRYTMDAERRVHDAFTGIEVAPEPVADGGDGLDDLFF
ncbi:MULTISPECIES: hypothetical protein [unclassified Devosia]|uniref:hypothetical protein n=1 Tax=unclassified Devosia TaxID=196773 RepID=UPI00086D40CC|nr:MULTISPECIES: hypothetical protein [unclassified Devosia]MBN9362918.1 hypothetical protein [Devosia sp.]ODS88467.1 MAG: hypothetical protein ABS47_10110 [Devosia sp. SCN 66-27]OJX23558.1 MAG: hypothetical protein BGO83_01430 [Devosia sp. 66-14]